MNFVAEPREKGTVIILGAGASFGASVRNKPPLVNDFIREGRKMKLGGAYSRLWDFLDSIGFKILDLESGTPDFEEIYSTLHTISMGLWHRDEEEFINDLCRELWKVPPVYFLESFIVEVVDKPSLEALRKTCVYHDKLVKQLSKGDTIISFNYDLIVDSSVWKNRNWSEVGGYGFPCFKLLKDNKENLSELEKPSDILLLKPHGSLNWRTYAPPILPIFRWNKEPDFTSPSRAKSFHERLLDTRTEGAFHTSASTPGPPRISVTLMKNINEHCYSGPLATQMAEAFEEMIANPALTELGKDVLEFHPFKFETAFIIPPTIYKFGDPYFPEDLAEVWSNIRKALSTANKIVCIGYSFRSADLQFNTLFRLAVRNNKNKDLEIEVVDREKEVGNRLRKIAPDTKIRHVADSFASYVNSL